MFAYNLFKQIDFFRKIQQDVNLQQTQRGGLLFIGMLTLTTVLVAHTFYALLYGEPIKHPYVDSHDPNVTVRVNLNISFLNSPCHGLSIDYQDVTGTHLEDIHHDMYKLRLDKNGNFIEFTEMERIRKLETKNFFPSNPRGLFRPSKANQPINDCYGAELYIGQKCLSCHDVMMAYASRNWPLPPLASIEQCKESQLSDLMKLEKQQKDQEQKDHEEMHRQQQLQEEERQRQMTEIILKQQQQYRQIEEAKRANMLTAEQQQQQIEQQQKDKERQEQEAEIKQVNDAGEFMSNNPQEQKNTDTNNGLQEQKLEDKENDSETAQNFDSGIIEPTIQTISPQPLEEEEQQQQLIIDNLSEVQVEYIQNSIQELRKLSQKVEQIAADNLSEEKVLTVGEMLKLLQKSVSEQDIIKIEASVKLAVLTPEILPPLTQHTISNIVLTRSDCTEVKYYSLQLQYTTYADDKTTNQQTFDLDPLQFEINQCQITTYVNLLPLMEDGNKTALLQISHSMEQKLQLREQDKVGELRFTLSSYDSSNNEQLAHPYNIIVIRTSEEKSATEQQTPVTNRRMLHTEDYGYEPGHQIVRIFGSYLTILYKLLSQQDFDMLKQQEGEGCQIYGHMYLKKVPGNFHVSWHNKGMASVFMGRQYSMRHRINLLEFTTMEAALTYGVYLQTTNSLDSAFCDMPADTDADYYIKIVNSKYEHWITENRDLYQFTFTNHVKSKAGQVPQVSFKYEFDPITMRYYWKNASLESLVVSLCAIIGGVFAISTFISRLLLK